MKTTLYTLALILLFSCKSTKSYAQYNIENLTPFIGTWQHQDGNDIFRVTIYEDNFYLKGHYWFIESINGVETIECESNINIPGTDIYNGHVIFGGSHNGVKMGASIDDNTINCEDGLEARDTIRGDFSLIIQDSCLGCPVTAEWKVVKQRGIRFEGDPTEFSIPTDVIMTKVE